MPEHHAFHRAFIRLTPKTLKAVNELVMQAAVKLGLEDGNRLRVDTTVDVAALGTTQSVTTSHRSVTQNRRNKNDSCGTVVYSAANIAMPTLPKGEKEPMSSLKVTLSCAALVMTLGIAHAQGKSKQKPAMRQPSAASGSETFLKYCASSHGEDGKGNGPAAIALKPPPSDLTTLSKRHEGKYPAGYVSALVKFGRSLAAHGSLDMPVWGSRFKELDPVRDPTGQQRIDDVVAYIGSLQAK